MTLRFGCTGCGRCCHDLRLPLSLLEAVSWLERGGEVEVLTDAVPDVPFEPTDASTAFRRERSLPGFSGTLPIVVNLTLVAAFSGACPHLLPSMLCGAYEKRPNTCRIYPAELLPGRLVYPGAKACPPEAWGFPGRAVLNQQGRPADPGVARAVQQARANGLADVAGKARLARLLGINTATLENEGLAVHRRLRSELLAVLETVVSGPIEPIEPIEWQFVSPSSKTHRLIEEAGAIAIAATESKTATFLWFS